MATKAKAAEITAVETVEAVTTPTKKQVMYLGPNKFDLGLITGSVYIDGVPAIVEQVKGLYPLLANLFIPLDRIGAAEVQLNTQGSALHAAYEQAKVRKGGNQ
ncbi:hypothetical protein [Veillonella sp.]|uniref:hypothetical protein n=1 Tax=Veillonella sp. TaxID=1926307 RepID=UPI0025CD314F|nr:hypothetical protein [Veillonella sp.]